MFDAEKFCRRDDIARYDGVAQAFLVHILQLDPAQCLFLSDESTLDDCYYADRPASMPDNAVWDQWILQRILVTYGVSLRTTRIRLIEVFQAIDDARCASRH